MKILLDFLPLILFFIVFKGAEGHAEAAAAFSTEHFGFLVSGGVVGAQEAPVLLATLVVMMATLAQAAILKLRGKKIDLMLWISLVLVVTPGRGHRLVPQRHLHQVEAHRAALGHGPSRFGSPRPGLARTSSRPCSAPSCSCPMPSGCA